MAIYFNGLLLGLSLIMALGPQNIFLIRQGVLRQHVTLSVITCFVCDATLVTASVLGLQEILQIHPQLRLWLIRFGVVFLVYYGLSALKRGYELSSQIQIKEQQSTKRWQIILLALGFSVLNPHAIIDSLVLIGGSSSQFLGHEHQFLLGVLSSCLLWFTGLTAVAYSFSEILTRKNTWRGIEFTAGLIMIYLGIKLASC